TNPPVSPSVIGNQLTIGLPTGFTGSFTVQVTVSDGQATASQSFLVTVAAPAVNHAPIFAALPNLSMKAGQRQITVNLPVSDPDGDPLTFGARVVTYSVAGANVLTRIPGLSALAAHGGAAG